MPELGRYEELPRPESIAKLIQYLEASKPVTEVKRESEQVIYIERVKHSPLRVYMTNLYVVALSDVYEILNQGNELDAIVTMSAWNGYTSEAKKSCKEKGIGLFRFNEFLGAIYYDGNRYFDYISPEEREQARRRQKRT